MRPQTCHKCLPKTPLFWPVQMSVLSVCPVHRPKCQKCGVSNASPHVLVLMRIERRCAGKNEGQGRTTIPNQPTTSMQGMQEKCKGEENHDDDYIIPELMRMRCVRNEMRRIGDDVETYTGETDDMRQEKILEGEQYAGQRWQKQVLQYQLPKSAANNK